MNLAQIFTPPEIANLMLDEVGFNCEYIKNNQDKISIIDPACGLGALLLPAVDRILKATNDKQQVINNVFGYDIDNRLVESLKTSNTLLNIFNTKDSISEFLNSKLLGTFDFVIANPPYIGYNTCCKAKMEFTQKIKNKDDSINLGNVYGVNLHSIPNNRKKYAPKPNLYAFFIALGLALLKKNGKMCYIIPQTILSNGDNDVLRYHLSNFTTIEKLIVFEDGIFVDRIKQNKKVATSSLIFVIKKADPPKDHKVKIITYKAGK